MNGLFGVNGLLGYLVAVVLLLSVVGVFTFLAIGVQKEEATNYYRLEKAHDIQMHNSDNEKQYRSTK
ncbi:DUF4006 family protein [Wolinella succinogenes]|uniref:DUF4006 family protein n=1 Tax=Wolinella succinogenes TaxID=844 RepID=UPI00240A6C5E|nr:DUF4006 family protein [Wolinella succinogenes]